MVINKPATETSEANGRPDAVVAKEAWDRHLLRNRSVSILCLGRAHHALQVVVDLFQFQLRSQINCPQCQREVVLFEPSMYLSVPLPAPSTQVCSPVMVITLKSAARYSM